MSACVTTGMVSAPDNLQLKWKKKKKKTATTQKKTQTPKKIMYLCV